METPQDFSNVWFLGAPCHFQCQQRRDLAPTAAVASDAAAAAAANWPLSDALRGLLTGRDLLWFD